VPAITEISELDHDGKEQLTVSRLAMDVIGSGQDFSQSPAFAEAMARRVWLWLVISLFVLGGACGTALRLSVFIVALIGAGIIRAAAGLRLSAGTALTYAIMTVITLQVGYAAGLLVRAAIRSYAIRAPSALETSRAPTDQRDGPNSQLY
jgi:hypothetical protein